MTTSTLPAPASRPTTLERHFMTSNDEDRQVQPFAAFLQQQARGGTHDDASEKLHDLIAAVLETGKPGKIGLTFDVKPLGKGDERQVIITGTVVSKMPVMKAAESFFFVDPSGNLSRTDPRQQELPLQDVSRPNPADAKVVGE